MGVNGKVGQAAAQIATWHGARVIGVVRRTEPYEGHANSQVEVIDASATDVATRVRELTGGKGADIVFNTVGDPYFEAAHKSLALRGRQILIAAVDRIVQFNILEFYRGQHTYVGIDTLGLSSVATGAVLRELGPGFASGHLKPFPIKAERDLSAGTGQGGLYRRGRIVARSRHPAALGYRLHAETNRPVCWRQRFCSPIVRSCGDSFSASADRGRTHASNVIAARKLHPI